MVDLLPEKAKHGLTWRRLKNALRTPSMLVRNAQFWWSDDVSEAAHVFVMGPPRSGTTLLKTVLCAHSDICGVEGETWFFLRRDYAGFRHPDVPDTEMKRLIGKANSVTGLFDRFAEMIRQEENATHFLEKTPEHALRLSYLVDHFPRSRFVFLVRDPRDGLRSAQNFPGYWATLPDEDRVGGYLETWRRCVAAYQRHADASSVLGLRYEDFCRGPAEELEHVLDHLGLEREPQQLDPSAYGAGHDEKVDAHARLREPITPKSVGAWREELSAKQVRRVERTLSEEMRAFGYPLEYEVVT